MSLRLSLIALLFSALCPLAAHATRPVPEDKLAVQLYSLHPGVARNLPATLAQIKSMGLSRVELYPLPNRPAEGLRKALDDAGLTAIGAHVPLADLEASALPATIERAKTLGAGYVGVAWIRPEGKSAPDAADIDRVAALYNAACPVLQKAGLGLMYHIHGYELTPGPDGTLFDRLMAATDPACVTVEMDTFWVAKSGADPVALLRRYPDRIRMLHLKDLRAGAARSENGQADKDDFAPVGEGSIDWPALVAAADGVQWFILEDESAQAAEHLRRSLSWLRGEKAAAPAP